jgi:hypothetical protein
LAGDWQLLGPAVKALGVLDPAALPLIEKYSRMLDRGHEEFLPQRRGPAIIRAHGWTAGVVDFALFRASAHAGQPVAAMARVGLGRRGRRRWRHA